LTVGNAPYDYGYINIGGVLYNLRAGLDTGTIAGGATLLNAGGFFSSNPAALRLAIYKFTSPVNSIRNIIWDRPEQFVNAGVGNCATAFQIEAVTVDFDPSDGQPTPPSAGAFSGFGVGAVVNQGPGVNNAIGMDCAALGELNLGVPIYGMRLVGQDLSGSWLNCAFGNPRPRFVYVIGRA
jgi:hypothetical protein